MGLMNDFGVNIVDLACFPDIPSEVKPDLFWTVQYFRRDRDPSGSTVFADSTAVVALNPAPTSTFEKLSFLSLKIRELSN